MLELRFPSAGRRTKEVKVKSANDNNLLDTILDSWDRNNRILVNLLRAIPEGGLDARVMPGSPSVAEMFTHIHYVRLVFLSEDAPEFGTQLPTDEWCNGSNTERIADELDSSARAVREAVENLVGSRQDMRLHYDHPLLYLQHMIWHEGYHHGQIKVALKAAGRPFEDEEIGPLTWRVWMDKSQGP